MIFSARSHFLGLKLLFKNYLKNWSNHFKLKFILSQHLSYWGETKPRIIIGRFLYIYLCMHTVRRREEEREREFYAISSTCSLILRQRAALSWYFRDFFHYLHFSMRLTYTKKNVFVRVNFYSIICSFFLSKIFFCIL